MKLAIVILNWNGRNLLEKYLPSVLKHSNGKAVYVVDNASTDDSLPYVKSNFPTIQTIELDENLGYAGGYNSALSTIEADFYCLLNSDVLVSENWLAPIEKHFENNASTAAIQPKVLDLKNSEFFEYAGAAGGYLDALGYPFCRGRIFDHIEKDNGQYQDTVPVFWASGACLFVRSSCFWEVGGFDSDFFAHFEEIDLCWRLQSKGYQVFCVPSATVYHVGGGTLAEHSFQKTYLNFRNSLYTLAKNLPTSCLFSTLFLRLVLDAPAAFRFLVKGQPIKLLAIVKAHFVFFLKLTKMLKKRQKFNITGYAFVNSILIQRFIFFKKTFQTIRKK